MKKRKIYGDTTPTCFFCDNPSTCVNEEGVGVCRVCKEKKEILCPLHKTPMEGRNGKFGGYYYCYECNKNWSKKALGMFRR